MSNLKSTYNKGFQMTFENGLTTSVQFGYGDYCANKDLKKSFGKEMESTVNECSNAEIIIWNSEGVDYKFPNSALGWVSPEKVADWIHRVSKATSLNDI